ncbi:L,D-transpeptidase [Nocardioides marmoribigeumensis]|uniref:L,D-TPase catalytic domain-containing protein n=1 Tax=Nocardioides marmoribigeumensis TaxID=433649 RepID=A0ABU2BUG2_9ACTN|nr:L,D-transpeptidase [Nocardioides marmoribigeumensis]MDR7361664.1 hypothetical protein [Nocardioides marmoribigeumensis]
MTQTTLPPTSARTQGSVVGDQAVRPRYGRIAAFGTSALVCAVAFLGGVGVLPDGASPAQAAPRAQGSLRLSDSTGELTDVVTTDPGTGPDAGSDAGSDASASHGRPDQGAAGDPEPAPVGSQPLPDVPDDASTAAEDVTEHPLPAGSGKGRRVVFDQGQQRVWLVTGTGTVLRTYLASGSVTDNLHPGTYEVYSHSEHAIGIDGTTMRWMVRFAHGDNAAIGFHDLPLGESGHPVQRLGDLGTPLSHGCIRQAPGDAQALWAFAPVGTKVVVTG